MAKKKKQPDPDPPAKGHTWAERSAYISNVGLPRDLAEWLTIIAREYGRQLGVRRFTVPELVDPVLRPWAWALVRPILERRLGTKLTNGPPDPDPRAVRPGLPGLE